ncbi:MAG: bifunctional precorrin-2 dehydrogenase/sirohydrochlorin ferrochelatase [Phycisphaeraceae bacterium]|nr:bifunctional precorrin-2 dehydrogenase/sirohydrochlorin ferrochelatase [Phycisphaeraceae bacterium]
MSRGLPVILKLQDRRCVIVGGGSVALRRAASLLECGARVKVIAPNIDPAIEAMATCGGVECVRRHFERGDIAGAVLVIAATDDQQVNELVAQEAAEWGALLNRADDPAQGDVSIPAHAHHGPVTIAVHTDGISAAAAAAIRRQLSDALDQDWPALLSVAGQFRAAVQQRFNDPAQRQSRLRQLTDDSAMAILKQQGEAALHTYLQRILDD